jgi:hypothetical protein
MMSFMKKVFGYSAVIALFFVLVPAVHAAVVEVSPVIIDLEMQSRESATRTITLKNTTGNKLALYATVNEVAVDTTGKIEKYVEPFYTDRSESITSWVEITRARIELEPGETREIPITIKINPYVKPGDYHAFIGFAQASKRFEAEAAALRGDADGVVLKVAFKEKKDELLHISNFAVKRFVIDENDRDVSVAVNNPGKHAAIPTGEIIFYNSRGEEVGSTPLNTEKVEVPAGESRTFAAHIPLQNELGRYKANATLYYGEETKSTIFDTTQFFLIPWPVVIGIIIVIVFLSLIVTYLIRRSLYDELHDEDGADVPLHIRDNKEHQVKDHDIHLTKN